MNTPDLSNKIRVVLCVTIMACLSGPAIAGVTPDMCPNLTKLKNICLMVGGRMIDKEGKSKYLYQTRFAEAACVSANDTQEQAYSKIRYVWDNNENLLKCTSGAFDVARGGLLKYAFSGEFDDFIDDAIRWQVNLNSIDESDQRTVLDYFTYYIDKNKGNALEQRYRNYYDKLRSAGAKHRVELK